LRQREGEEIDARQEPEIAGAQADRAGEIGRNHGDRIAQELGHHVDGDQRADQHQGRARRGRQPWSRAIL
jgi:hypothetical protein